MGVDAHTKKCKLGIESESARAKAVTQRTSFADVETSKSRIIPESEVVRTSDELNGKAKMTGGAKTQKDLQ